RVLRVVLKKAQLFDQGLVGEEPVGHLQQLALRDLWIHTHIPCSAACPTSFAGNKLTIAFHARARGMQKRWRCAAYAAGAPPETQARGYTSRFWTYLAFASINSRRGSTLSPIRMLKISSAATRSSTVTCKIVRVSGFIVVCQSCSASISPRPLYRWTSTP